MSDANTREPNLLIIRRGGSAELETPKGGVWKIAYADFMTAMMAFFLVMWLINATSETTKTGVANYFNPIKLASGTHLPKKGLQDPEAGEQAENGQEGHEAAEAAAEHADAEAAQAEGSEHAASEKQARFTEEALFRDPYAVLAAIAAGAEGTTSLVGQGGYGSVGAGGEDRAGDDYGDPFDPAAWQVTASQAAAEHMQGAEDDAGGLVEQLRAHAATEQQAAPDAIAAGKNTEAGGADAEVEAARADELAGENSPAHGLADSTSPQTAHDGAMAGRASAGNAQASAPGEIASGRQAQLHGAGESASAEPASADANDAAATGPLRERIAQALELGSAQAPNVTVESADGGVLISLADQVEFGMFAVGSAEPLPETIAVMARIATLLNAMPGKVVIRGHTDGRPFRSGDYDNWRLSSARAHMAYHMLVRGGLDESRVERIEGYADRALKLPQDPEAAENRRIDILVQEVHS
jgi:chemotaxis protein MotB